MGEGEGVGVGVGVVARTVTPEVEDALTGDACPSGPPSHDIIDAPSPKKA